MSKKDPVSAVKLYDLDSLTVDPRNARTHDEAQIIQLEGSMMRFGWTVPMLVEDQRDNLIRAGHGRRAAARNIWARGLDIKLPSGAVLPRGKVPGIDVSGWSEDDSRAYALADNQLALQAGWDTDLLRAELDAIEAAGIDLFDLGFDADSLAALEAAAIDDAEGRGKATPGKMAAEFLIPPFSVLSAREGWWQERKRQWIALGIKSEVGRGGNLIGHSLHSMVALALARPYDEAVAFINERRERGMSDQEILTEANGGKPMRLGRAAGASAFSNQADLNKAQRGKGDTFGTGSVSGGGRLPGESTADRLFRQQAMRAGAGRCFGQDMLDGEGNIPMARGERQSVTGGRKPAVPGNGTTPSSPSYSDPDHYRHQSGEKGRKPGLGGVTMDALSSHPRYYEQKTAAEARVGRVLSNEEFERDHWRLPDSELSSGTSIFDPVLCEIAYRWWCPPGGLVLDPFAGGSVRGVVAAALGRRYVGVDLRAEQIEANREQWPLIKPQLVAVEGEPGPDPEWHVGDSMTALDELAPEADFLFSCPPYGDLEVYSDVPGDLSTLDATEFDRQYAEIIGKAVARLNPDRFACFVVGDYREKGPGFYRNFVSKTIAAFEAGGARLYNECILLTSAGSLAIRAGKQFRATRKVGKTHQNVLVFCKGDPRRATAACGPVDVTGALERFVEDADIAPDLAEPLTDEPEALDQVEAAA